MKIANDRGASGKDSWFANFEMMLAGFVAVERIWRVIPIKQKKEFIGDLGSRSSSRCHHP